MLISERALRPEMQRGRVRLTTRDPDIEKLLSGLAIEGNEIEQVRIFGKALWAERNRFDIRRRAGGMFFPNRQIDKGEADRLWRAKLAELLAGGGQ